MKPAIPRVLLLSFLLLPAACSHGPIARTGWAMGGLGGAADGGVFANHSGRTMDGALVGGGIGAQGGNVIGGGQAQHNAPRRNGNRYVENRYKDRRGGNRYTENRYDDRLD